MTSKSSRQERDILRSHSESTGGMKADFVLKMYVLLMRHVLPSSNANSGDNEEVRSPQDQEQGQDECNLKYEETMRRISALGWSSDLRNLPEMNLRVALVTSDVQSILDIPATDEMHMEDRNHGLA